MKLIAAVRRMDAQRAAGEIPKLGRTLQEMMGESVRVLTSRHPDAQDIGRQLAERFRLPTFESLGYLSEENGTQHPEDPPYAGNSNELFRLLTEKGEGTNGVIVVADYKIYCDLTDFFKRQEFRGSGRHRIPPIDEATATIFDLEERKLRYL